MRQDKKITKIKHVKYRNLGEMNLISNVPRFEDLSTYQQNSKLDHSFVDQKETTWMMFKTDAID